MSLCAEDRGQPAAVVLFLPCGSWGLDSGCLLGGKCLYLLSFFIGTVYFSLLFVLWHQI